MDIPDRLLTTSAVSNLISLQKWDEMGYYWAERGRRTQPWKDWSYAGVEDCANGKFEYEKLYRIMTRRAISDRELSALIGRTWEDGQNATDVGFSWVHRQEWGKAFSVFQADREISEDVEVAEGIFWMGGGDEVASSMEMSRKMGRNVASIVAQTQDRVRRFGAAHGEL